ncbi:MAG: vitamin K epoxide reductase family protein [Candidatus Paceibacterota bacterium]
MINIWILPLSIAGLIVSWHIFHKKRSGQKLVCVIGEDCDKVIHSKYSKTLGISNEIIGILYYGLVASLTVISVIGLTMIGPVSLSLFLVIIAGAAAVFSLILIFIQAFVLREWCEYCLVSAGISIVIFVIEATPLWALYKL